MGGEYRLEHRAEQELPAPTPAVEFDAPDQVEAALPIPGLAMPADPIRRSTDDPLGGSAVGEVVGALRRRAGSGEAL